MDDINRLNESNSADVNLSNGILKRQKVSSAVKMIKISDSIKAVHTRKCNQQGGVSYCVVIARTEMDHNSAQSSASH